MKKQFHEDELKIVGKHISPLMTYSFAGSIPKRNTPITPRENFLSALKRDGNVMWIPFNTDILNVQGRINIDHIARAEVMDLTPLLTLEEKGGPDLFGIEWVFVPTAGGSMVQPGAPTLTDVNDWPDVIHFPDVDALDWEGWAKANEAFRDTERTFQIGFQNGLFERLISFMDFEGAAMAIIDDDQKDAIHALFAKLCDMYEAFITHYCQYFPVNGVMFHDDWGAQHSPFFSPDTVREMILPYLKRLADFCHAHGMYFHQHSCGKNEKLVPCMIEAGVDMWMPQNINDVDMLRERYGDKIVLGVTPTVDPKASDEEIDAAAKAFVEKYCPQLRERPIVMRDNGLDRRFTDKVYQYSRIYLSQK